MNEEEELQQKADGAHDEYTLGLTRDELQKDLDELKAMILNPKTDLEDTRKKVEEIMKKTYSLW